MYYCALLLTSALYKCIIILSQEVCGFGSLEVAHLRHVKDPYNGVEVATVGKIASYFSPTVPPFTARGLSRRFGCGGAWRCKWELPKHRVVQ
jgi:hypothetical protein